MSDETPKRVRVLNVNDRDIPRYIAEEMLRREGFEPVSAASGEEALALAGAGDLEVAVLDVDLPGVSGFEVCRRLKANPATEGMIVLLTSATFVSGRNKASGLDAGADGYLVQPYESAELLATLRSLLRTRSAERRAQALAGELRAAMEVRDEFLAMLGHELRNPLAAITTALQVMESKRDERTTQRCLGVVSRQARSLERIISDLLDVARIKRGKVVLDQAPVELRELARRCAEALDAEARGSGHQLTLELPEEKLFVRGDQVRLEQVLSNLLTNAIKYTPRGGHLALRVSRAGGNGVLEVSDDGIGMSAEVRARVFDVFVQAKQSLDRSRGGLGLGLSVVRQLVEMHGGEVSAHSAGEGKGSRFVVELPLLAAPVEDASAPPPAPPAPAPEQGLDVVVVEDNEDAREMAVSALELLHHRVSAAADGVAGLELILSRRPAVAVVDIGLPGLDGYELARRVRAQMDGSGPKLIALTGYGQPEDKRRALEAGFDVHLVKPVSMEALQRLVEGMLAGEGQPAPREA